MDGLEFFTSEEDVFVQDGAECSRLTEDSPIVNMILERVETMYPDAAKALKGCYGKSSANVRYYNFLIARRFCKCNFGSLDRTFKDFDGIFNFERVPCPLRGECKYDGVICLPEVQTRLTDAEKRVMRLVCKGLSNMQISEELYLSPNTVKRHIATAFLKTGVRNRTEFLKYANENSIFN